MASEGSIACVVYLDQLHGIIKSETLLVNGEEVHL